MANVYFSTVADSARSAMMKHLGIIAQRLADR